MNQSHLARKAVSASFWSIFRFGSDQVFNLIVFIIVARILSPAEIGRFAIAMIFYELARLVVVNGLPTTLTRSPELTDELKDTIFITTIGAGCIIATVAVLFQAPIAATLGAAGSGSVVAALALTLPIAAAGASHMALNLREFGHRALAIRSVLSGIVGGGIALVAVFNGAGLWALVFQRVAIEVIGAAVSFASYRWIPGLRFSFRTLKAQAGLAASISATQLVWVALIRSQDLIIGRTLGPAMVGVYRTAWKSIEMVAQGVVVPIGNVAVPVLTRVQTDPTAFERAFLGMTSAAVSLALPAVIGMGLTAHDLIPIVYGAQWTQAVPVLQVLSLLMIPLSLNQFIGQSLTVLGRSKALLVIALIQSVLSVSACIFAARFGITAVALAFVVADYIGMGAQLMIFQKASGIRIPSVARAIRPQCCAAALMAAVVWGVQLLMTQFGLASSEASLWRLVASVVFGASAYGAGLVLFGGIAPLLRIVSVIRGNGPAAAATPTL